MNSGNLVFCRLCAKMKPNNKIVDLTCDTEKRNEVIKKLVRLNTPTEFIDTKLPSTVCFECICSLNKCFDFVVNIENAQDVLNDIYLQNVKQEASSDDEASSGASGALDVHSEVESDDGMCSSVLPKTVQVLDKVKKSNSLDSIPLTQLKQTSASFSRFKTTEELKQFKDAYLKVKNLSLIRNGLTCTECSKTFKSKGSLYGHLAMHRNRKREYMCDVCGRCFYRKQHLADHILIHREDRPHKCQICKAAFRNRSMLKSHLSVHNKDKPFSCDKCGRCFKMRKHLRSHGIIHTDTFPYECSECKKKFHFKTGLNSHICVQNKDMPFSCDQCGRRFKIREQLESHRITHTGSFPYECSQCKKKFHFKIGLNNHACMNTGVKPYSCELCQREFAHSTYYRRHMKRKHNQDTSKKKDTLDGWYLLDPSTGQLIDQKKGRPSKADQSSNQSVVESEEVDNSN